ncbi:5062_t:CDS:1, partial [Ambispora leptoticha]
DQKRVQEWRKQKKELEAIKNDHNSSVDKMRVLPGRGRKAIYPTVEKELLEYIKKKREERMAVTTSMIGRKAKELGQALNIQGAKFSSGWVECFMRRNKLVEHVRTQYAQKLPEDMPSVIKEFLQTSREKTKNIEKKFIISFDETPMWFDMPRNTTIDFEGVHKVPIKTIGNKKLRFT